MASNVVNRETVRDAVSTILSTAIVGAGYAQAFYGYQVADFARQSPVVVVTSGAAKRGNLASKEIGDTQFKIIIHTFVLYATDDGTWTEAESEDKVDALEKKIIDLLIDAFDVQNWLTLDAMDFSEVYPEIVGEEEYRHEEITLTIGVM